MHETGNGQNTHYNNVGGMMDPSTGGQSKMKFSSIPEGIYAMARNLKNNYIDQGLNSIASIQQKYAPVGADNDPYGLNSDWINGVSNFYRSLGT